MKFILSYHINLRMADEMLTNALKEMWLPLKLYIRFSAQRAIIKKNDSSKLE